MVKPTHAAQCQKHLMVTPELHAAVVALAQRSNAKLYVVTDEVVRAGLRQKAGDTRDADMTVANDSRQ